MEGVKMSKTTPEGKVKWAVKKLLAKQGVWFFMPVSMGWGKQGIPDFVCCINGKFWGIECKAESKLTTALQDKCIQAIRDAGGGVFIVDGVNGVGMEMLKVFLMLGGGK
jgi:hypothetical protein